MHQQTTRPVTTTRLCRCGSRHRRWTTLAKCRWPRAIWIIGDGPYASVAHCVAARAEEPYFGRAYRGSQTVALYPTREDAQWALEWVAATGCGGVCVGRSGHELVDLGVAA